MKLTLIRVLSPILSMILCRLPIRRFGLPHAKSAECGNWHRALDIGGVKGGGTSVSELEVRYSYSLHHGLDTSFV